MTRRPLAAGAGLFDGDHAVGMEGVKGEREIDPVDGIDQAIGGLFLDHHVADVAPFADGRRIEGGI